MKDKFTMLIMTFIVIAIFGVIGMFGVIIYNEINETDKSNALSEVTRLCTNGAKNACSFLYGAAARAAAAMGYKRIITYTLESENGASLRASGWICQGKAGGLRWTGKRQPKEEQYPAQMKLRYEKQLGKEETVNGICSGPEGS